MPFYPTEPVKVSRPALERTVAVLFLLMLFGFGAALVWVGSDAIAHGRYLLRWSYDWGPEQQELLQGQRAIQFGIGELATGLMLVSWGLMLLGSWLLSETASTTNSKLTRSLGWLSLACLVVASVGFFPFWKVSSAPYYLMLLAFPLMARFAPRLGKSWAPLGLIGATIVVAQIDASAGSKLMIGIFASLALLVHLALLLPRLLKLPPEPAASMNEKLPT